MTHLQRLREFVSPSHHAVHAVSLHLHFVACARKLTDNCLVLTPPKGTNRTLPSIFKTVNGPPKGLRYLQYGFLRTCVMGIRPLRIP